MERTMVWNKAQSGRMVTCSDCSWWAPVHGENTGWVGPEFEFHTCHDYPPLKFAQELEQTG